MQNFYIKNSLNRNNVNNNPYYKKNYKSIEKNFEKDIINSMKDSLDTFLINLKAESSSKSMTIEDVQNYYLTESEKLNSLNLDLISPYQALIKNNLYKNYSSKNKLLKRAYSTDHLPNRNNPSQIYYNNYNKNSYKINSYFDKNLSEITKNNSFLYNDSINKSLTITNHNNIVNIPKRIYEKKQNKKIDYPIKLINNNYNNRNNLNLAHLENSNNNLFMNAKKAYESTKNFQKRIIFKEKSNLNNNIILYIKKELKKIKQNNNLNKIKIKEFYSFYSQLINTIFAKIIHYIKTFEKGKITNFQKEIIFLKKQIA